jgi:hypothetical protein
LRSVAEMALGAGCRGGAGMWRSLVSAPALGAGGPGFESPHPDAYFSNVLPILTSRRTLLLVVA